MKFLIHRYKAGSPDLKIHVTNGWLVCDGKLLVGGVQEINWWKGNLLPKRHEELRREPDTLHTRPPRCGPYG